jgi:HK97 family phage portal protein
MRIQDRKTVPWLTGGVLGAKAVTLGDFDNWLDAQISGAGNTAQELYASVAWSYWCAQLRASSLASVPYDVYPAELPEDEEDKENAIEWPLPLQTILWDTEAWMSLKGAAYIWEKRKRSQLLKLQVLNANTMKVKTYNDDGPLTFEQKVGSRTKIYQADEIVYFRTYNPANDIREGVSSGEVGQTAGQLIANANTWAAAFFENGAIPAVLLTTEGSVPPVEKDRVETAWAKMFAGVRKAFKTAVLERGLTPTVIGQPVSDLAMPELEATKRNQIVAAHNIPPGLAEVKTNRAERDALQWEFWTFSMIPYMQTRIVPVLNDQLFEPLGLRISFHYNEVEAIQREEIKKAESAAFYVEGVANVAYDANVISVDEYRRVVDKVLTMGDMPALDTSFTPEERAPPPMLAAQNDEAADEGEPTSANPKASLQWGRHRVSLVSLPDGETRRSGGASPSTLTAT